MELTALWFGFAVVAGVIAQSRGRNGFGWFILGILISGLLALILVVFLPNLKVEREKEASRRAEQIQAADSKTCPKCAESVKRAAKVCRFCGYEFTEADTPVRTASYDGPQPRQGNQSSGRPTGRGSYNGTPYVTHSDGSIVARIGDAQYTWESAPAFERWADAYPHLLNAR